MDCITFMRTWVYRLQNKEITRNEFISVVSNYPLFKDDADYEIPNGRLEGVLFNIKCARAYLENKDYNKLNKKLDGAESFLRLYVRESGIDSDYFKEK